MSLPQSRSDKSDTQYKKLGRSGSSGNQQRSFQGRGGGRSGGTVPPPASSLSSSHSFKATNNAQGGQSRTTVPNVNQSSNVSTAPQRTVQNGAHLQPTIPASNVPITGIGSNPSIQAVPTPLPSQSATMSAVTAAPTTPAKPAGGPSMQFPLQFGSISPGVMSRVQLPARTSSAPPNLVEQKRDQVRHESFRPGPGPSYPVPSVPKQPLPKKDASVAEKVITPEAHSSTNTKKEAQVPPGPIRIQTQKSNTVLPIGGIPIQTPYHQPHVPLQFGAPNPQFQYQEPLARPILPMVGTTSQLPQQVYLTHPMQHQGILHQVQGSGYPPQMGHQIPPQFGMGFTPPQYPQHVPAKFSSPRRPVKITDPKTHKDVKLDQPMATTSVDVGLKGSKPHPNTPQSQSIPSFTMPPMNYYHNTYNAPRPTISVSQGLQPTSFINPHTLNTSNVNSIFVGKGDSSKVLSQPVNNSQGSIQPLKSVQGVTVLTASKQSASASTDVPVDTAVPTNSLVPELTAASRVIITENKKTEINSRTTSIKDIQKNQEQKIHPHTQQPQQVAEQSIAAVPETVEAQKASATSDNAFKSTSELPLNSTPTTLLVNEPITDCVGQGSIDDPVKVVDSRDITSAVVDSHTELDSVRKKITSTNESATLGVKVKEGEEPTSCQTVIDKDLILDASTTIKGNEEVVEAMLDKELFVKNEGEESVDNITDEHVSLVLESKEKTTVEQSRVNNPVPKKKKLKELLQKADAAGSNSDLYNAYKGPEEKKDAFVSSESTSNKIDPKQVAIIADSLKDAVVSKSEAQSKSEPDDWEDAADITTPNLVTKDNPELLIKKYSRDFLLKFEDHCKDLPQGFEIIPDIESLIGDRDSQPSPGRNLDRSASANRGDRRGNMVDDNKWSKVHGSFNSGRDFIDVGGYGGNVVGQPRQGQGGNFGASRSIRASGGPAQYAGGILSGPTQPMGGFHGGMQRNNTDADRWQRATSFQKGLVPPPQTPLQMMHKAENKYEIGKVSDEEQAKQRQLKGVLNKLTPQNFEKLFEQVKAVNIDNTVTLTGVIAQIFDKALTEPTFCEMYANFCQHLSKELPDLSKDGETVTFRRLLLNKCQEEFERDAREQEEADRIEEGEVKLSKEEREEKRVQGRRRMLGNIRLIGELYKKKMLTERIMHSCIQKLLGENQNPDEEDIEALCKLMSTIGEMIDHPKAKEHIDAYFDAMFNLSNNTKFSSRLRFMLRDAIDLRRNHWQQRRKVDGPKKIEEVHRDAAQERQAQSQVGRFSSSNSSVRRGPPPMEFGSRGGPSMLPSPNTQMGSIRGYPTQGRGYGNQDARVEERQPYEAKPLTVPLPQRPVGDDYITLGPQGGLARGMSNRGPPSISGSANGYNAASTDQTNYGSMPRPIGQSSAEERNIAYSEPLASAPSAGVQGPGLTPNSLSEELSEEQLSELSLTAIREFYSAKDKNEIYLCIKDLKSPSFHPTMISVWVADSFERKDKERELLVELLSDLMKSQDGLLAQAHLLKGFELVLETLEDAVNDAPKAPEFLGRIFAKTILEDVIPMETIGKLIHTGGEEPGSLLESGLAADVLGSILEIVQTEKGNNFLNQMQVSSNLRWASFRPPGSMKSRKLEKFI